MLGKSPNQNQANLFSPCIETNEYPEEAVREALLNTIFHKDYSVTAPIQISVYNDKLMIWNPGQLPENRTVDNLISVSKNRLSSVIPDMRDQGGIAPHFFGITVIFGPCASQDYCPELSPSCYNRPLWLTVFVL